VNVRFLKQREVTMWKEIIKISFDMLSKTFRVSRSCNFCIQHGIKSKDGVTS
jgi:hypothetical protein